jgi:cyclopropane-fatty-acyl-phospholipid synthase
VRALGFDEPFCRMWDYYLAFCEGAFRERHISDVQLMLTKNNSPATLFGEVSYLRSADLVMRSALR